MQDLKSQYKTVSQPAIAKNAGELDFKGAAERLKGVIYHTPLSYNKNLSRKYN